MYSSSISILEIGELEQSQIKRTVFIKAVFLKIEDINTIQEYFSGLVFVQARWREPLLDSCFGKDVSNINWDGMWDPKLDINNTLGDVKEQIWRDVQFTAKGEAYAIEKRRVKGKFTERMELQEFPFDVQDLSLLITSGYKEEVIRLEEDEEDISSVVIDTFVDVQEWDLKNFVQSEPRALISSLSFATFAIHRTRTWNRVQLSFILILACVTFKFAALQSVPKISYLTHLDRYILCTMLYLFCVAVWHASLSRFDRSESGTMDLYAYTTFIGVYISLHILFFIVMVVRKRLAKFHRRQSIKAEISKSSNWRMRSAPATQIVDIKL
ncbi:cys-loop ligand-gated ion channel-like isoform X4 [Elysia marginata]|uniref:Cys-loop ligand-gated ion channel-like isoform X4 n=1 Tax=Elysia marginata TaxID=1093978 RepID=A0AAV4HJ32_9GAST|nr:cys-loop ligand-gated ion channel-like isoform X4 [Elysia marginata]